MLACLLAATLVAPAAVRAQADGKQADGKTDARADEQVADASDTKPPNIVFILSDDKDVALHAYAPKVKRLIEDEGTTFDNAFVTYSLC